MAFEETVPRSEQQPVDLLSDDMRLLYEIAPIYLIYETVKVQPMKGGQTVEWYLQDEVWRSGVCFTLPGDVLLINTRGERIVMSGDEYKHRYYPTSQSTAITFKGWVRAFQNPSGRPIMSMVDGTVLEGGVACMFVMPVDGEKHDRFIGPPSLVEADDFAARHMPDNEATAYFPKASAISEHIRRWFRKRFALTRNMVRHPIDKR